MENMNQVTLSGFALIRFPSGQSLLRRTEQGLSGCADALSLRAAALYTVPAVRIHSRCIPVRSRLHLQGTGLPREKSPAELAKSLVDLTML